MEIACPVKIGTCSRLVCFVYDRALTVAQRGVLFPLGFDPTSKSCLHGQHVDGKGYLIFSNISRTFHSRNLYKAR